MQVFNMETVKKKRSLTTKRMLCRDNNEGDIAKVTCHSCSQASVTIFELKQDLFKLTRLLESEKSKCLSLETQHRQESEAYDRKHTGDPSDRAGWHVTKELDYCKEELEYTKRTLEETSRELERLRSKCLQETICGPQPLCAARATEELQQDLSSLGKRYLDTIILETQMFRAGESVTPVKVLHKVFESLTGSKESGRFLVLLDTVNTMLAQRHPDWYAANFGFCKPTKCGETISTERLTVEDFAWLVFEYNAQTALAMVLLATMNVCNGTTKGGVTASAIGTSKSMCNFYLSTFMTTAAEAAKTFRNVVKKAKAVREVQGIVYMPVTAGLLSQADESRPNGDKNQVLISVFEGLHNATARVKVPISNEDTLANDPLELGQSVAAFVKRKHVLASEKTLDFDKRNFTEFSMF